MKLNHQLLIALRAAELRSERRPVSLAGQIAPQIEQPEPKPQPTGWTDERKAMLRQLWDENKSQREIAQALGVSQTGVVKAAERFGLPPISREETNRRISRGRRADRPFLRPEGK